MPCKKIRAIAMAIPLLCAARAQAGGSLFVDDAAITPRGHCQLELWARAYAPARELTAAPACTVAGTEFSFGASAFARSSEDSLINLGAKQLFRDFDRSPWGIGMSAGATWNADEARLDGWNINLPVSVALDPARRTVLHANLGWADARQGDDALTGGIGVEQAVGDRWVLLGEVYGDHRGTRATQLGLRRLLAADASVDVLMGHQVDDESARWLTLGFNVLLTQ